jgi:predicted DNA-binding transcriptional regulator
VALGINPHELFSVAVSPERAIEQLQQKVVKNIEQVVADAIEKNIKEQCKDNKPK